MVTIDRQSGFCFGVVTAIQKAEEELHHGAGLYCLGDIVHNGQEVERLEKMGLRTINHEQFGHLRGGETVLIRAHGEPPSTYRIAQQRGINLIDASCPVVRHLQQRIRRIYTEHKDAQIIIFGKHGHAEVVGLQGQTDNTALVIEQISDAQKIDFEKDIYLFSQTTKSVAEFKELIATIEELRGSGNEHLFMWYDTICGQVRNRVQHIRDFAAAQDKVVFVGGRNSSNGAVLYEHCKQINSDTIFIESTDELSEDYLRECREKRVGVCGATSTPLWLMEMCAERIRQFND